MTTITATPSAAQAVQTYTDKLKAQGNPLLGMVVWYSVPTTAKIKYQDFCDQIDNNDAPIDKKKQPNKANVFRRACTHATLLKQRGPDSDTRCNYTVSDAGPDSEFVFKSIVEQTVDGKEHQLDHRIVGNMAFHKDSGKLVFVDEIDDTDFAWATYEAMKNNIRSFIAIEKDTLHDLPIRESARTAVENNLNGVRVRPGGGVYFVSIDKAEQLEAVNTVINSVDTATFHMLPLPDDPEQRSMLKNEFENEVLEVCGTLIDDLTALLGSSKGITAKKAEDLLARHTHVKQKTTEFSALLSDALTRADTEITIVEKQIRKMLDKIGE